MKLTELRLIIKEELTKVLEMDQYEVGISSNTFYENIIRANDIDNWDDKTVEKMYSAYLDELSNAEREIEEKKHLTIEDKRKVLKNQEDAFAKQFNENENAGIKVGEDFLVRKNKDHNDSIEIVNIWDWEGISIKKQDIPELIKTLQTYVK